jgi:hypothetical protein
MDLRWTIDRLRAMSLREVAHRSAQQLRTTLQQAGLGLARPVPASTARGRPWVEVIASGFASDAYHEAAERILSGKFRLFGNREWLLGFPPAWNRDPATGRCAPLKFGKTLDYRDILAVGNIKYLWELNRQLEVVTLAQAWHLTREERFALGCRTLVDSWVSQCPYMSGANWTSSLELALRLINWSFAWHLLGGDDSVLFRGPDGRVFKERWLTAVRQHCHFIDGYPSLYSSANNHLLGELLGLLIGSITWPCWAESARWRVRALRDFEHQALLQNSADGVNKEHAIWYHHEVADMMLLAGLTAIHNGCNFGTPYWQRLEAMLDFIASCMDAGGHVPALGDADDAVMVRFCPAVDFDVYRSLLATGSVLWARGDFKHKGREFDDKSRWLLGDGAGEKFAAIVPDSSAGRLRRKFELGGYYILGGDFETAREVRLVADAAPLGYLSLAAHGHADALAFTLSIAGHPILIDPGTYCYHTERRWRDYFRGTSAHNTVRVDRLDQSVSAGTFLWIRHAQARCLLFETGSDCDRLIAEHDGYKRLADPVVHRRDIVYERASACVTITDSIACQSAHYLEIFWHFAPQSNVTLGDSAATVVQGAVGLTLHWPSSLHAELVRAGTDSCLGWISPRFDEKVPADTLVISGEVAGNWQGVSTLAIAVE